MIYLVIRHSYDDYGSPDGDYVVKAFKNINDANNLKNERERVDSWSRYSVEEIKLE